MSFLTAVKTAVKVSCVYETFITDTESFFMSIHICTRIPTDAGARFLLTLARCFTESTDVPVPGTSEKYFSKF